MSYAIEVRNLKKSFGSVKAVDGLSFAVEKGELFAFLGENGAGKSTTISILCRILPQDEGEVRIDGTTWEEGGTSMKSRIGVVFQSSVLDSALSGKENLRHRAALYGICGAAFQKRLETLSALLDLREILGRPVGKLSGGQRRRLDIARALISEPSILILDEPTTGLDPQTRAMLWGVISDLQKKEGLTVLLTTHYMEEAAEADSVVIIEKGRVVAQGTPLQLKSRYTVDHIFLYGVTREEATSLGVPFEEIPQGFRLEVENTEAATRLILENPKLFRDYEVTKGKMDDVFLTVTGKNLKGGDAL
ncbi:MAG: ABC transporter ATP-binding protein [Clostridia bacterium]|nr:ABC transporter ATP-binding protein [Clostridia bacterium]